MFTARSVARASARLAFPKPPVVRAAAPFQYRAMSATASRFKKSEVIKEAEVPVSVYTPDSKGVASANSDHFSIPVKNVPSSTAPVEHVEAEEDSISPLDEKVYQKMPPTMQKMSVMGKVIIVTG